MHNLEPASNIYDTTGPSPGKTGRRSNLRTGKAAAERRARRNGEDITNGDFEECIRATPTDKSPLHRVRERLMEGALPGSDSGSRSQSSTDSLALPGILKESRPTSSAQPSRNEFKVDKPGSHPRSSDLAERISEGMTTADITEVIKESATAGTAINKSSASVDIRFVDTNPNGTINIVAILTLRTDLKSLPEVKAAGKQRTTVLGALQNLLLDCMESNDVGRVQRAQGTYVGA